MRRRRIANVKFFFYEDLNITYSSIILLYRLRFSENLFFSASSYFIVIPYYFRCIEKRICNVVNSILNIEHCNKNFISSIPKISNKNSMINRCIYKFLKFINNKVKFIKIININSII